MPHVVGAASGLKGAHSGTSALGGALSSGDVVRRAVRGQPRAEGSAEVLGLVHLQERLIR